MKNLILRTVSGIVYIIVFLGAILLGKYTAGLLLISLSSIGLNEFFKIALKTGAHPFIIPALVINSIILALSFFVCAGMVDSYVLWITVPLFILLFTAAIYSKNPAVMKDLSLTFFGLAYITLPLALMNYILFPAFNGHQYTWKILTGLLLLIWTNDTGAYLVGSTLGRHKLYERISPKKSWEGAIGGAVFTMLLGYFMVSFLNILSVFDWIVLSAIVSVFGVYGDMAESLLKRNADIKDSGTLIPGHGGILDRVDSILFVMPLAFFYLIFMHL